MAHDFLLQEYARKLRKSATEEENLLWYQFLRTYPIQFRRQKVIGRYIVDFFCSEARLVVEVDGGQHFEDSGRISDVERTEYLEQMRGFQVLRFTNLEIKYQFTEVCSVIDRKVQQNVPSSVSLRSTASPQGEALGKHLPLGGKVPPKGADEGAGQNLLYQENNVKTVTIYTDGACSGNPGPGGWGAILMYGPHKKELSGGEAQTTNNRMELTGVITALEALKEPCAVELYSDSKYVIDALEKGWAKGWRARGWVKGDKKPALNPDLWARLLDLCEYHTVNLHWVKGHASNPYNNRCDELAVAESRKFK